MTTKEALDYAKSYMTVEGVPISAKECTSCIVEALEKQIPKKPKYVDDINIHCFCPVCGQHVCIDREYLKEVYQYCPKCGQALDWSTVK